MPDVGTPEEVLGAVVGQVAEQLAGGAGWSDAVHRLLAVVRTQLGMQTAWLSEFVGDVQVLRFVDSALGGRGPAEGARVPMSGTFCARVLDGRFPGLIPDARTEPDAALLSSAHGVTVGAYVGVPLLGPAGTATGMLCVVDEHACPDLTERDHAALALLAQLLTDLQQRALGEAEAADRRRHLDRDVAAVVRGHGRHAVLQPVVDLTDGRAVAVEGLTRFTSARHDGSVRSPAQWFDDAARLGLREELEVAAAGAVLDLLPCVPDDVAVAVNLGPQALLSGALEDLLAGRPLERIVVEVTEHAPVGDYGALERALAPYRAGGLRLAVDDAGAGYASLTHVLAVRPELVKVDMALVHGADTDLARQTLLRALAAFADSIGARLVAEGVETAGELRAVRDCGVHLVQGFYLARPSTTPVWSGYPVP